MKKFLVVDDSVTVRKIARRLLEEMQFSVEEAPDGAAGLDACRKGAPDAILLDWNMPVMNGIEFLRSLRALENGRTPIVIFCTTESSMDHIGEALEAGADEYIIKPFDGPLLESKLVQTGLL